MADAEEVVAFDSTGELVKEFLVESDVALVRLSYLRQLLDGQCTLPRRQAVPREALVVGDALKRLTFGKRSGEARLFVVSHAWLSLQHPDPSGARLAELVFQIDRLGSNDESLVFLDYCCLYQIDKRHPDVGLLKAGERLRPGHPAGITPPQIKSLQAAVTGIDVLYASAVSDVVVLPALHDIGMHAGEACTRNRHEYINRGWCRLEFCVAKAFGRVANTSLAKVREMLGRDQSLEPEDLERKLLRGDIVFGCPADKKGVLALYRRYHSAATKAHLVAEIKQGRAAEHTQAIVAGLGALDWRVRRDLLVALGAKKVSDCTTDVCGRLVDPDHRVRRAAKAAASRMRPVKELAVEVIEQLKDPDTEVLVDVLRSLVKRGPISLSQADVVVGQLSHKDVFVAKAATEALLKMGLAGADAIAPHLAHRDAQMRDAAQGVVKSLGAAGFTAAARTLGSEISAHVNAGPGDALRELLRALEACGPAASEFSDVAAKQLLHRDASVRCAASDAVLKMGELGATSTAALLSHHDPDARSQAIRSLEKFAPEVAQLHADAVARLLTDECWAVRRHAVHFMASIGAPELEPHAIELQRLFEEDPDEDVRLEAASLFERRPSLGDAADRQRQELLDSQAKPEADCLDVEALIAAGIGGLFHDPLIAAGAAAAAGGDFELDL